MPLKFPKKPEIPLKKPPLAEVICQVKFSPILNIAKGLPTDFQEAVRGRFPGLEVEQGVVLLPVSGISEKHLMDATPRIYRFVASNGTTNLALATDFIALSTKSYNHWQDFRQDLAMAEKALREIYHPAYATRVGLRFINRFTKRNTASKNFLEILGLFRNELTCVLHTEAWQEPKEMLSQIILSDDVADLALRIGLGREQKEKFFLLDFDYYEEGRITFQGLSKRVDRYHSRIYSAFRWCMQNESLERFEPQIGG